MIVEENKKVHRAIVKVIIPAMNEEKSIGKVITEVPKTWVDEIIVVDNASTDTTYREAKKHGATALKQANKGYGNACLKGIEYINNSNDKADIVLFLDGDYSDYPQEAPELLKPILYQGYDLVIGSRALGEREKKSMTFPQVFGNWLATTLLHLFYGVRFTDLGPFRAIRYSKLLAIGMEDRNYGWTVEMQLKAAKYKLKCLEVPVNYRKRLGTSKVSGTVKGTVMAGYKILFTIFRYLF